MSTEAGMLHILWENHIQSEDRSRYRLLFDRGRYFKSGGQQSKRLLGKDRLESYLVKMKLTAHEAKHWINQAHEKLYVSIPNVMMPLEQMAVYEQPVRRHDWGCRTALTPSV
jgi:hypothetical protein